MARERASKFFIKSITSLKLGQCFAEYMKSIKIKIIKMHNLKLTVLLPDLLL